MQFLKNSLPVFLLATLASLFSCQKETLPTNLSDEGPIPAKVFENLTFTPKLAYFSTDGSMLAPVEVGDAKSVAGKIDITYIYSHIAGEPGFLSPATRSQQTASNEYYDPSLQSDRKVTFYTTDLTAQDVQSAKGDQSKIAEYFGDYQRIEIAPSNGYVRGTGIGGKPTYKSEPVLLREGKVFGFLLSDTGQRGLIYIRTDQQGALPSPETKVDIVLEHER